MAKCRADWAGEMQMQRSFHWNIIFTKLTSIFVTGERGVSLIILSLGEWYGVSCNSWKVQKSREREERQEQLWRSRAIPAAVKIQIKKRKNIKTSSQRIREHLGAAPPRGEEWGFSDDDLPQGGSPPSSDSQTWRYFKWLSRIWTKHCTCPLTRWGMWGLGIDPGNQSYQLDHLGCCRSGESSNVDISQLLSWSDLI